MMYQPKEENFTKEEHLAAAAILASFAEQISSSRIQSQAIPALLNNELMMSRPVFVPTISSNRATEAPSSTQLLFSKFNKPFPLELLEILNSNDHADILRWIPNGKAFIILDKKRLTTEILPLYFKKTQFASFARKLTWWDFKRISKGPYAGAYYHKSFRRDIDRPYSSLTCAPDAPTCKKVVSSIPMLNYTGFDCRNPPSRAASSPSPLSEMKNPTIGGLKSSVTMVPRPLAHEEKEVVKVREKKLRFRMIKFRSEHKWHRQQFTQLYTNKNTEPCSSRNNIPNFPRPAPTTSHRPEMTANTIIEEGTKVLEGNFTLGLSHHNNTRHTHQQSILRQITLEKYHDKCSYYDAGCKKRSLQKIFDVPV